MKVFIATTFREFDGSENDQIQRRFLKGLSSQSHTDIELVVTTFRERTVDKALSEYDILSTIIAGSSGDYRFSLTEVFSNCIDVAVKACGNNYLMIWTTCDVIFPPNFIRDMAELYETKGGRLSVISHPHRIYSDISALDREQYVIHGPADGIDFVGFSGQGISDGFVEDINKYYFSDWGVFEHYLVAMAVKFNFSRYNLYDLGQVMKICNDRTVNNEDDQYFQMSLNKNWPVFDKFLTDSNLSPGYYSLVFCNLKFKPVGEFSSVLKYRKRFLKNYAMYYLMPYYRVLLKILPRKVKDIIKGVLK